MARKMKRTLRIVESIEKYNKKLNKKIAEDKIDKPVRDIIMTPETFYQVFSPERIRLLQRLRKNKIKNIYQLAKELNKPYEVVFRNIKYLEGLGLVKVKEMGRKRVPQVDCGLSIEFFGEVAEI